MHTLPGIVSGTRSSGNSSPLAKTGRKPATVQSADGHEWEGNLCTSQTALGRGHNIALLQASIFAPIRFKRFSNAGRRGRARNSAPPARQADTRSPPRTVIVTEQLKARAFSAQLKSIRALQNVLSLGCLSVMVERADFREPARRPRVIKSCPIDARVAQIAGKLVRVIG